MATSESKKALRADRKSKGLCIHCGTPAQQGQTRCTRCATRDSENRKRYAVRDIKQGICPNVGCKNQVSSGKRYCDSCNVISATRTAKRRKARLAAGLCAQCGKVPPIAGQTRCRTCASKLNASVAATTARREAAGLCGRCGQPAITDYKRCQACIDEARNRHNARKRRVMDAYGGPICIGCGEDEIRILQLDHIDNNGHKHALAVGNGDYVSGRAKMYKWTEDNNFPPGFQVLCPNCNIKKARGIPLPNDNP